MSWLITEIYRVSEHQTTYCSLLKWFRYSDVQYSDSHLFYLDEDDQLILTTETEERFSDADDDVEDTEMRESGIREHS